MKRKNTKRPDGRYAVQVFAGRVDGKRRYKTVYGKTQKEADQKAEVLRYKLGKGIDILAETVKFRVIAERWITSKQNSISAAQVTVYRSTLKHINSYIGDYEITRIRLFDLQHVVDELSAFNPNTGEPASRRMLESIKSTSKQVFDYAIACRLLDYNPALSITLPKNNSKTDRRALTPDEQSWIISTPHRAQTAAMIMMYAGLRRGELLALTWNDIDLTEKTISVNKSVEFINNKPSLKIGGKTSSATRLIAIPDALVDYLRNCKRDTLLVCPNTSGELMSVTSWRCLWDSYLCDLNLKYGTSSAPSKYDPHGVPITIPKFTAHWLRHTYATMLYISGVDLLTAKEQLGHSKVATTIDLYTHLDAIYKKKKISNLDEFIRRQA